MSTTCETCGGGGIVFGPDASASTCHCVIIKGWVRYVKSTPGLENVRKLGEGCVHLRGSALVRCPRQMIAEHVAGWLFSRVRLGQRPKVLLTSCADLRTLAAGGEEKGVSKLGELASYDLVVVCLLGQRNKFTPDALVEALYKAKRVWLVYPPGREWGESHPAWSPEIEDTTADWERVDLVPAAPVIAADAEVAFDAFLAKKGGAK